MSYYITEEQVDRAFAKHQLGSIEERRKRFSNYRKEAEEDLSQKRAFWGKWNHFFREASAASITLFALTLIITWVVDLGTGLVWDRLSWDIWISWLAGAFLTFAIVFGYLENISHTQWKRCYWSERLHWENDPLPAHLQQKKEQVERALDEEGLYGCYNFWIQESKMGMILVLYLRGIKRPIPIGGEPA